MSAVNEQKIAKLNRQAKTIRGDNMSLYRWIKVVVHPIFIFLFRPVVEGKDNLPEGQNYLLAANHRSFFDSVFQGLVLDQPIHWMAKSELFKYPIIDRLLIRLGAFPVKRGEGDQVAIETARALLEAGEIVAVFPEGTRVRQGLGQPRKGAARLALEADVAVVPMAIVGTEKGALRRAIWHQGERVRMQIEPAVFPEQSEPTPESAEELTEQVWPRIKRGVSQLEGHRRQAVALGASALIAAGVTLIVKRKKRG